MSQLAMDYNLEISKPRKNAFVANHIEEGTFGGDDAGLESIAAGGLHTLFVDEKGTVRPNVLSHQHAHTDLLLHLKVWSCGTNDNGALGRVTVQIPDPKDDRAALEVDEKTQDPVWKPVPIHSLEEESFRAVKIVAGDSFSAAISDKGGLRAWGAFSVRMLPCAMVECQAHAGSPGQPRPRRLLEPF